MGSEARVNEIQGLRRLNDTLRARVATLEAEKERQQSQSNRMLAESMAREVELRLFVAQVTGEKADWLQSKADDLAKKCAPTDASKG